MIIILRTYPPPTPKRVLDPHDCVCVCVFTCKNTHFLSVVKYKKKQTRELARPIECANIEAGSICGTSCHDHECDRINCLPDCATIEFQVHLLLSKHTYDVTKDTEKTHEEFHGILSGNCFRANL